MPATAATATARARASLLSLLGLSLFSIVFGTIVFSSCFWTPWKEAEFIPMMGPGGIRRHLNLNPTTLTWTSIFGTWKKGSSLQQTWDMSINIFWGILVFFRNALRTRFCRGEALAILVTGAPVVTSILVDALRDASPTRTSIVFAFLLLMAGQLITIGAALNVFYVPVYAWKRATQVSNRPELVYPLAPPTQLALFLLWLVLIPMGLIWLSTTFVNSLRDEWIWTNIAFQFYPLAILPLLYWPRFRRLAGEHGKPVSNTMPSGDGDGTLIVFANRQGAALYKYLTLICFIGHGFTLSLLWPGLKSLARALWHDRTWLNLALLLRDPTEWVEQVHTIVKDGGIVSDGEWVFLFDLLGVVVAQYVLVLIDAWADEWQVEQKIASKTKGKKRVHAARFVMEDLFIGFPALVLLGPGVGFARYLQRRETEAEKARFQALTGEDKEE